MSAGNLFSLMIGGMLLLRSVLLCIFISPCSSLQYQYQYQYHPTTTTPSTMTAFAFPDSRKRGSQYKATTCSRQSYTSKKQNISTLLQLYNANANANANDNDSVDAQQQPQRRFRSAAKANAAANNINTNAEYSTQGPYSSRNDPRLFTKKQTAPPQLLSSPNNPNNDDNSFILSPSVLIQNNQNQNQCLPYIAGELPITYTNDAKTLTQWLTEHCTKQNNNEHTFLGFDVEAFPNVPWLKPANAHFTNRPATVQLSTPTSSIVIHLTRELEVLSPLQAMLADPTILKVGAGIDEDMLELYRWNNNLDAKSRFDIGGIGSGPKRQRTSLQKLVRAIVGVELEKSKKLAMSDWSRIPLSSKQLCYASRDAWAGAAVMESIGRNYDGMQVDSLASLVRGVERDMVDVDSRAKMRKVTKTKMKDIMDQLKETTSFATMVEGENGRERHNKLMALMPEDTRIEMDRLQSMMDETFPDGLIFFDAEKLGLDFSFA